MELRVRRGAQLLGRFHVVVHRTAGGAHEFKGVAALGPDVEMQVGFLRPEIRALTPISLLR